MADFYLPNEIWCKIFSYLPLAPKKNATVTCKLWWSLIREDQKLSGFISISWWFLENALETLQWNWNNWPALKILELNKLELVEDSREATQKVIEKLSLKDCPSLKLVLFDFDVMPIQKLDQTLLQYLTYTDQIFGLGQKLDSNQKWKEYESIMKTIRSWNYKPDNTILTPYSLAQWDLYIGQLLTK